MCLVPADVVDACPCDHARGGEEGVQIKVLTRRRENFSWKISLTDWVCHCCGHVYMLEKR